MSKDLKDWREVTTPYRLGGQLWGLAISREYIPQALVDYKIDATGEELGQVYMGWDAMGTSYNTWVEECMITKN